VIPSQISALTLDAFLLARYGSPGNLGQPEGRAWERAVSGLLIRPGIARRQHAGTLGLFGAPSASGALHELDGAGHGHEVGAWLECKARVELGKEDVAVFAFKCLDLYKGTIAEDPRAATDACWWPVFVSSEPTTESVKRSCISLGIVLCEPESLPLPVLLRIAGKPNADEYLSETELAEFVRLAEPHVGPIQSRWHFDLERKALWTPLRQHTRREIGDLLYLQDELTGDFMDAVDLHAPGYLEHRAAELTDRLVAASQSV